LTRRRVRRSSSCAGLTRASSTRRKRATHDCRSLGARIKSRRDGGFFLLRAARAPPFGGCAHPALRRPPLGLRSGAGPSPASGTAVRGIFTHSGRPTGWGGADCVCGWDSRGVGCR
jgi:hypothetical protein